MNPNEIPNEIPTPRTDEEVVYFDYENTRGEVLQKEYVTFDFARTLERELHLANQQVEELKRDLDGTEKLSDTLLEQITKLEAACAEKDEALEIAKQWIETDSHKDFCKCNQEAASDGRISCTFCDDVISVSNTIDKAQSTTSGQRILDENERMRKALEEIENESIDRHAIYIAEEALNPPTNL